MTSKTKFSPEVRGRALRMVLDREHEHQNSFVGLRRPPYTGASAITLAPDFSPDEIGQSAGGFKSGWHFAAWLGLTPKPHSSGGKERLTAPLPLRLRLKKHLLRAVPHMTPRPSDRIRRDLISFQSGVARTGGGNSPSGVPVPTESGPDGSTVCS